MSYAILRTAKLNSWGSIGASAAHTYRTIPTPNADPSKLALNICGRGTKGDILGDVRTRVEEVTGGNIRKGGVLCIELLLTASPEFFDGLKLSELSTWAKANTAWLKATFGENNLTHLVLHRDEKTPHLVAYVVPEVGGKMNCRAILGGREKLRDLQSSYAEAMVKFGLQRGLEGSRRKHVPTREHYAKANKSADSVIQEIKKLSEPGPVPTKLKMIMEGPDKVLDTWRGKERSRTAKLAQEAVRLALQVAEMKEEVSELSEALQVSNTELKNTKSELAQTYAQLGLSKEEISMLRKFDISAVSQRLGYYGEIQKGENSIDLVKRIGGFDYGEAIAWLHSEFGSVVVSKAVGQDNPERPFTTSEKVIAKAVATQVDALGCDKFRVSLVPADETKKPYLPGKPKGAKSEETFFDRETLRNLIPFLRYRNNQGDNVFITPMDDHAQYILLDDSKLSGQELLKRGFQPCVIQKTSWESTQAVFKVPKDLDRSAVLSVFNELNKSIGDDEITGLRHPFRLAGFRNMKPKHEREGLRPFVEVKLAMNRFCDQCTKMVRAVMKKQQELELTLPGAPGFR